MNQGKWEKIKQEMARLNIDIYRISELEWTGVVNLIQMTIISTTVGNNPFRRNRIALIVNNRVQDAILGCKLKKMIE